MADAAEVVRLVHLQGRAKAVASTTLRNRGQEKQPTQIQWRWHPSSHAVSFPATPAGGAAVFRPRGAAAGAGVVRAAAGSAEGGGKWWAPLVGWSGKADYLEAPAPVVAVAQDGAAAARRQFVGGLTEEKARELRARMAQTESFHDAMYHSAIASRLARSA
ncbi:hypothetical protein SETIT_3G103300v2 [Setaria italica]|uniref:Uncharacterized protein n=1 Tax=Setaria italica TaxID=4555 RepID=A0A368QDE2_SETIT|nr:hypothetical protein SETIT_3G103300v2 [Setaria italica]